MKKRILSILLTLCMVLCLIPTAVFAEGSPDITGAGTAEDPYLISTAAGLKWFRDKVNYGAHFLCGKLMNDIVLNDGTFDEDGNYTKGESGKDAEKWEPIDSYSGTFDGNGHTVKGLYVNGEEYAGLFSTAAIMYGTVKNVAVTGYVSGEHAGGIAGEILAGSISNCLNYCTVTGSKHAGGIAGTSDTTINNCFNTGSVSGSSYAGGIAGTSDATINNCFNTGSVSGSGEQSWVGGIVGSSTTSSRITNCYNTGSVSGFGEHHSIGGIAGDSCYNTITNCYNVGQVSSADETDCIGGIVGRQVKGTVNNCYYPTGVADKGIGYTEYSPTVTNTEAKSKAEFADGTVLKLLKQNDTINAWQRECGYLNAAGMTLPLLSWQTADAHTHNKNGDFGGCDCGQLPTGTADDPYLISNAQELKQFRDKVNGGDTGICAKLMNDIVLNDGTFDENGNYTKGASGKDPEAWTPIGTDSNPYTGTFDGGGHTIKGLYVDVTNIAGLFGEIGSSSSGATIRDVTVDGYVKGTIVAGGIAGMAFNSATSIQNCVNRCYVVATSKSYGSGNAGGIVGIFVGSISGCTNTGAVSGTNYVGGIAGYAAGSIRGCANTGAVSGDARVGGIAGYAVGGSISSCYNTGAVSGTDYVGGVAGRASASTVSSCYNTGAVSGTDYVGGIAGYAAGGSISSCANTGTVSGTDQVGGVAGRALASTVSSCYNTGTVSGDTRVGGVAGYVLTDYDANASVSDCYNTGTVEGTNQVGGVAGYVFVDPGANASITSCYYLTGTAENAVGENAGGTVTNVEAKSKTQFADGTVLALLKQNDTTNAWQSECGYLAAAGMTLPLLSWQTADAHTCTPENPSQWESDESGHWQVCSCGLSVNKAAHSGTDDGDCTTEVSCDKCDYVIKLAQTKHNWSDWEHLTTTHTRKCNNPGCSATDTKNCLDENKDHKCDTCEAVMSQCADNNNDHICDICNKTISNHDDADGDHICDICNKAISNHDDADGDHKCDICNKVISNHDDADGDHICDVCNKAISNHNDTNSDHICDICNKAISNHNDADSDHICDICNKTISNHDDADSDHICDICNKAISNHDDADSDHICDICNKTISNHDDANSDHICDICNKAISNHDDADSDHICDICDKVISNHTGGTATCKDKAVCEVCGESYGELDPNNHANLKHIDAKAATKTSEGNIEYWYCEGCGKYFADKDGAKEITKADTVTAKLPEEKPTSPKTGDTSNLALWIALLFISGGVITVTTVVSKKKRHS